MKYFDENKMGEIRKALEKEVLRWPGVSVKEMMGCLCYFYGNRFFAFLVTKGIVITKLSEDYRVELSNNVGGEPFEMAGKTAKTWIKVTLKEPQEVRTILPFVKKSYESAVIGKK
jgi:hypothetical protein